MKKFLSNCSACGAVVAQSRKSEHGKPLPVEMVLHYASAHPDSPLTRVMLERGWDKAEVNN